MHRTKHQGFTLIELMIVIAIIAIIAAIAIPSLIKSKISANEAAASNSLKTFNSMLATYRQKGYSGFGRVYPHAVGAETNAGKYCGLHFEVNNGHEKVALIGIAEAAADAGASPNSGPLNGAVVTYIPVVKTTMGRWYITPIQFELNAKQGYWFALCRSNQEGFWYDQKKSKNHYGLLCAPEDYGSSGESTFVINEQGTVYVMDFGYADFQRFPGPDPINNGWEIAQ